MSNDNSTSNSDNIGRTCNNITNRTNSNNSNTNIGNNSNVIRFTVTLTQWWSIWRALGCCLGALIVG